MRETSENHKEIFTAKCPHGEKYGEMSHGEKVVRRNVPRRNVLTVKCPYGEMSHGEVSHGEVSGHSEVTASATFSCLLGSHLQTLKEFFKGIIMCWGKTGVKKLLNVRGVESTNMGIFLRLLY